MQKLDDICDKVYRNESISLLVVCVHLSMYVDQVSNCAVCLLPGHFFLLFLVTDASFLQKFTSSLHKRFVETLSWVTSLSTDVIRLVALRCVDGTFSPAVVRHLLGIIHYRSVHRVTAVVRSAWSDSDSDMNC